MVYADKSAMDAIVVFGRDSDLDLRSGHRLADSVSSFLCSDLCNFGDLIWANHETICKQRRQCIKLPWGIVCTFPVSRIFLPTAWALPPHQGVWYQYVCLQSRKLLFSLEEVSHHTLSQAENLSVFLSQVLPFAVLKRKGV